MKVCILGSGLVSLTLAKSLVNLGLYVDIYSENQIIRNKNRTIGISKTNVEFFNRHIFNIKKLLWNIKSIEIYSEILNNEKILSFYDKNNLFSILKNDRLLHLLINQLKKNKLVSFKKIKISDKILNNYNLIFNCDFKNSLTKKYFYNKFSKDYKSTAYISTFNHAKIKNDTAIQIFTSKGPFAFLPVSEKETSVVFSFRGNEKIDLVKTIKQINPKYKIISIKNSSSFKLNSFFLRSYYYKNILAFGDLLHKIHPLAGQGFNMSLRDIKSLLEIIKFRLKNGLDLDSSICSEFEESMRHKNYIFNNGIDFIYELFYLETKTKNKLLGKSIKYLGKNRIIKKFLTRIADHGVNI